MAQDARRYERVASGNQGFDNSKYLLRLNPSGERLLVDIAQLLSHLQTIRHGAWASGSVPGAQCEGSQSIECNRARGIVASGLACLRRVHQEERLVLLLDIPQRGVWMHTGRNLIRRGKPPVQQRCQENPCLK